MSKFVKKAVSMGMPAGTAGIYTVTSSDEKDHSTGGGVSVTFTLQNKGEGFSRTLRLSAFPEHRNRKDEASEKSIEAHANYGAICNLLAAGDDLSEVAVGVFLFANAIQAKVMPKEALSECIEWAKTRAERQRVYHSGSRAAAAITGAHTDAPKVRVEEEEALPF